MEDVCRWCTFRCEWPLRIKTSVVWWRHTNFDITWADRRRVAVLLRYVYSSTRLPHSARVSSPLFGFKKSAIILYTSVFRCLFLLILCFFFYYSFHVCFLVFCFASYFVCFTFLYFFPQVYSGFLSIFIRVCWPVPPGGTPIAVNKYRIPKEMLKQSCNIVERLHQLVDSKRTA